MHDAVVMSRKGIDARMWAANHFTVGPTVPYLNCPPDTSNLVRLPGNYEIQKSHDKTRTGKLHIAYLLFLTIGLREFFSEFKLDVNTPPTLCEEYDSRRDGRSSTKQLSHRRIENANENVYFECTYL